MAFVLDVMVQESKYVQPVMVMACVRCVTERETVRRVAELPNAQIVQTVMAAVGLVKVMAMCGYWQRQ